MSRRRPPSGDNKIVEQDQPLRDAAGQPFYNTSAFTLRNLQSITNRQQLEAYFRAYLDGLSRNGAGKPEPELDRLSQVIKAFNDIWGDIEWNDRDRVERIPTNELPAKVSADPAYRNAMAHGDSENARVEHGHALRRAMQSFLTDDTQLFKQFSDNEDFRRWMTEMVFTETYEPGSEGGEQMELAGR